VFTREYHSWAHAKGRCHNPRNFQYRNYGARGIKMCKAWQEFFETFYADMGPCPLGHTIDRINNDGHYEPGNCRWAPREIQANNTRSNRCLSMGGETMTIADWARRTGLSSRLIQDRVHKLGWSVERALTTPVR
jgi:hypothetical protein